MAGNTKLLEALMQSSLAMMNMMARITNQNGVNISTGDVVESIQNIQDVQNNPISVPLREPAVVETPNIAETLPTVTEIKARPLEPVITPLESAKINEKDMRKLYIVNLDMESRKDVIHGGVDKYRLAFHTDATIPLQVYLGESVDKIIKVINYDGCGDGYTDELTTDLCTIMGADDTHDHKVYFMTYYIVPRDGLHYALNLLK